MGNTGQHFVGFLHHSFEKKKLKAEKRVQISANLPMLITNNQSLPWPKNVFAAENLSCFRLMTLFEALLISKYQTYCDTCLKNMELARVIGKRWSLLPRLSRSKRRLRFHLPKKIFHQIVEERLLIPTSVVSPAKAIYQSAFFGPEFQHFLACDYAARNG